MATGYNRTTYTKTDNGITKDNRLIQSCHSTDDRYKMEYVFEEEDSEVLLLLFEPELNVYNTRDENCKIIKKQEPTSEVSLQCLDDRVLSRIKNDIYKLLDDVYVCEWETPNPEIFKEIQDYLRDSSDCIKMKTYTNGDRQVIQFFANTKYKKVKTLEQMIKKTFTKRPKNLHGKNADKRTSLRMGAESAKKANDEQKKTDSFNTNKESNLSFPKGNEDRKSSVQVRSDDQKVFYTNKLPNGLTLKLVKGSIIHMHVNAIVNAANEGLQNEGGVAYAVSQKAGKTFDIECRDFIRNKGHIGVTKNVITGAGNLKYECVIHAVGPRWEDYQNKEKCLDDVKQTVIGILKTATEKKFKSIAMPPISSGIFSVPKRLCAAMYVAAVTEYDEKFYPRMELPEEFIIVDINDEILGFIRDRCTEWQCDKKIDTKMILSNYLQKHGMYGGCYHDHMQSMYSKGSSMDQHHLYPQKDHEGESSRRDKEMKGMLMHIERDYKQNECKKVNEKTFVIGGKLEVKIYSADIVHINGVDILVSAESRSVNGLGPLARQILNHAGKKYVSEHRNLLGSQEPPKYFGDILETSAGILSYRYVLHVVTDRFSNEANICHQLPQAQKTMSNLLKRANELSHQNTIKGKRKVKSMAMSLLGAGAVTKQSTLTKICESLFDSIQTFVRNEKVVLEEIHLVNLNGSITDTLGKVFSSGSSGSVNKPKTRPLPPTPRAMSDEIDLNCLTVQQKKHLYEWHIPPRRPDINVRQFMQPVTGNKGQKDPTDVNCVVCMDKKKNPVQLINCKHQFCKECISEYFSHKLVCPVCNLTYGEIYGSQPEDGIAYIYKDEVSLEGFPGTCTWIIHYVFPDGKQTENHPHPGTPYRGIQRVAYLPDNEAGKKVLNMLEKAFKQRLTFTIGSSRTTGRNNVVTWNDIHHKTRRNGGPERFGYPDDEYLSRVTEELAAKGIKP